MMMNKFALLEVRLCGKLCVAVKDTSCTIRLLAKFEYPARASDKTRLNQVNHVKYLIILIDSTLSWKPHITELSKKIARNCGIFYKIRHYVKVDTLKRLYYLFFSLLSYGVTVWGLTHPSILEVCFKNLWTKF